MMYRNIALCLSIASLPAPVGAAATGVHAAAGTVLARTAAEQHRAMPQTADGIWRAIDAQCAQLRRNIDGNALARVHQQAFAIRDLVAALATHSPTLTADRLAKVRNGAKYVATLAARLDAAGDAGDRAGTQHDYAKLTALLRSIKDNYGPEK